MNHLTPAGLVVTAVYEDGTRTVVTGYEMAGFDSTAPGLKTITVFYRGKQQIYRYGKKAMRTDLTMMTRMTIKTRMTITTVISGSHGSSGSSAVRTVLPDTVKGNWRQDENGWWFETTDGGYVKSDWARINEKMVLFQRTGIHGSRLGIGSESLVLSGRGWSHGGLYLDPGSGNVVFPAKRRCHGRRPVGSVERKLVLFKQ